MHGTVIVLVEVERTEEVEDVTSGVVAERVIVDVVEPPWHWLHGIVITLVEVERAVVVREVSEIEVIEVSSSDLEGKGARVLEKKILSGILFVVTAEVRVVTVEPP